MGERSPTSPEHGLHHGPRGRLVGVLVPSLTWSWVGEVLRGAAQVIEDQDYGLLLFTCDRGRDSMRQFAERVQTRSLDGLLVVEPGDTLEYVCDLHAGGLPVVLIDDQARRPSFPRVPTANRDGGRSAARHLLRLGRCRPAVVTGPSRFGFTRERLAGFAEPYHAAGLPLDPGLVAEGDFTFERGRAAVRRLLDAGARFDAVFAHDGPSAAGAMEGLREGGWAVPQDVAVVGFDDQQFPVPTDPPLTTVCQPSRETGATAARILLAYVAGTSPPGPVASVHTSLIVRGSTVFAG
jgi:LacI family transcriptional regulator